MLAAILPVACGSGPPTEATAEGDDAITVASFNFPESVLLAELYAQALESAGFRVERQLNLGTRELVQPALQRGLVEFVPEYAGSTLEFVAGAGSASPDERTTHRALAQALAARGIAVLAAAPAEDQNGFVVTRTTAGRFGLRTISDLSSVAEEFIFGGPPECPQRPLCLRGLSSTYGLTFDRFVPLDESGPLTAAALREGHVQVALMFTTDGAIDANRFVVLEDDRQLQPAENVTPVVRQVILDRFGARVAAVADAVSASLTTGDLRGMNADVAGGLRPRDVAARWLAAHGLTEAVE